MSETEDDLWQKTQELFAETIELPEPQRLPHLRRRCGDNRSLYTEVATLLRAFESDEADLEVSPVDMLPESSGQTIAHDAIPGYEIESELVRGGQGVVFRAIQLGTGRTVAVKFLLAGPLSGAIAKKRFKREAKLTGSLRHPGIVTIFDSGVAAGQSYLVMEYVDGLRLQDHLKRTGPDLQQSVRLMASICDAVGHAHDRGIVHRDLKPSNILVENDGQPRILDFGLATLGGGRHDSTPLSVTGQIMGTLSYMSPEQTEGRRKEIGTSSDVYSLAVIFYEMLAGRLPYDLEGTLTENLAAIQSVRPAPLPDDVAPRAVRQIVMRGLSKDTSRRYTNAGAMRDDLERALAGDAIERQGAAFLARIRDQRRLLLGVFLLGWFAFVCVAIGVYFNRGEPPRTEIAEPLRTLEPGETYSIADFESQLDSLRDFSMAAYKPDELLREFESRFGHLEESQFDESMTDQRRKDFEILKDLDRFLKSEPVASEIEAYKRAFDNRRLAMDDNRPSGLAIDLVTAVMESAIDQAGTER